MKYSTALLSYGVWCDPTSVTLPWVVVMSFNCFLCQWCTFGVPGSRACFIWLLHLLFPHLALRVVVWLIAFNCIWVASSTRAVRFVLRLQKVKSLAPAKHFRLASSQSVPKAKVSRISSSCKSCV